MGNETFTEAQYPLDPAYAQKRRAMIKQLMQLSVPELEERLNWQMMQRAPRDENGMTQKLMSDLQHPSMPSMLRKGILDSTGGTTGNVLIRQDLEPTLYTLFVKVFPAWERLRKGPSNGLTKPAPIAKFAA